MTASEILMLIFTAVIAVTGVIGAIIFGGQLTVMRRQWNEMKSAGAYTKTAADAAMLSAEVSKLSVVAVQRAFVFVTAIKPSQAADIRSNDVIGWNFDVQLENSGDTPATNVIARISHKTFNDDLPDDFDFADFEAKDIPGFIPPRSTITMTVGQPINEIEAVTQNKKRLFLWGWVEYDDIFEGTPRHRVDYCFEIKISGEAKSSANFAIPEMYRRHNRHYDIARALP